jgi:L-alanine-DL-glutamate epimerase-like enolase superfamily enzyme
MKITDVQSVVLSIPLQVPTAFATTLVTAREYVIAWVETDEGPRGLGFTIGRRGPDWHRTSVGAHVPDYAVDGP